jgi:hypothetical protein
MRIIVHIEGLNTYFRIKDAGSIQFTVYRGFNTRCGIPLLLTVTSSMRICSRVLLLLASRAKCTARAWEGSVQEGV